MASKNEVSGAGAAVISLRVGQHPQYYRIVLEGAEEIVSKGHVKQNEKDIHISFDNISINVRKKHIPFAYKADKDSVVVSLPKEGEMKVFSLEKPSRLVVDVYPESNRKKIRLTRRKRSGINSDPDNSDAVVSAGADKEISKGERTVVKQRTPDDDRSLPLVERKMGKIAVKSFKQKGSGRKRSGYQDSEHDKAGLDEIIVPEKYEELWSLLKSGNAIGNLIKLPGIEPEGTEELAFYYYLFGEGYAAGGQYIKAIDHLRLAYVYAEGSDIRELSLFRRAEVYEMMGLNHEARTNYLVFIDQFPGSKRIETAYLGLANCSQKLGHLNEAVQYYDRAGDDAETLFQKANTLQKLERVEEAKKIYELANKADDSYPKRSFETYYLFGENMRLTGELKRAKEHFNNIQYGPFLDSAKISLALIAMDEANVKEAGRNFLLASESKNRDIRVRALFSLAFTLLSIGQTQEATEALEEIRFKHLDSDLYNDALAALARLYRKEGKVREAVSIIKELVYGKEPPADTFSELEAIVLDLSEKDKSKDSDELTFLELWNEMDTWLMNESKEEFLLRMARRLRYEGKPFIKLSMWLIENGSSKARVKAAVALADYFVGIGKIGLAEAYMTRAVDIEKPDDDALRIRAKILRAKGEYMSAVRAISQIKNFVNEDLTFAGFLLLDLDEAKSARMDEAIAFYEKKLNESERDADHYVRLADILYKNKTQKKALDYYRIAYKKNPDDEWILYRIGSDGSWPESKKVLTRLDKGGTMLGHLAKSKLFEIDLLNKIREVY